MCGIAGSGEKELTRRVVEELEHRGSSTQIREVEGLSLGHRLHSVVGEAEQPVHGEGVLAANCEIYNWQELNERYGWETENDAETLLRLLDRKGVEGLEETDGIYAFAYINEGELVLARDVLGINPLWISEEGLAFASEKQALEAQGVRCRELHPRRILRIDLETGERSFEQREFLKIDVEDEGLDRTAEKVKEKFIDAVEKRIPEGEVALLFSGGVDSTMVAKALQRLGKDFTAYSAGIQHGNVDAPRDAQWAEKIADQMDIPLQTYEAGLEEVDDALGGLTDWISSTSVVKSGVALPFHFSLKQADEKVVFSGLGSEELYAGYHRHQGYLNRECLSGLRNLYERDLYRDNVVAFRNGTELRLPFLDLDLVEHALSIPEEYKKQDGYRKYIVRKAAEKLGVPDEVVWREKTSAQYGSNFDKAIDRLARDNGYDHKQAYLNSKRSKPNNRLVALTSGGKDSYAALNRTQRRNNEAECLLTLRSKNKDSYMFDSNKDQSMIEQQASKLGIPLITQETEGEKEEELEDLKKGLQRARESFGVEGVVSGAIASTYQRDRVEKVAEDTGLKVFTPLWQEDQKSYMERLIRQGFKIEITDVAARGLESSWENKVLTEKNIEEFLGLAEEYGFNPAGEGGEYETTVRGFPEEML